MHVTSEYFHEPDINKHNLVMKSGDSQQVTIQITNNDSDPPSLIFKCQQTILCTNTGFFHLNQSQIKIKPNETKTLIL